MSWKETDSSRPDHEPACCADISSPLERSEAKIVQFRGGFETQEIRHSVIELEVGCKAGKHDIARMSQRKDDFGICKQPVDQRQDVHR